MVIDVKNLLTTYDYKSPGLIGRTFFYDGLQIRRDAWRGVGTAGEGGFQGTKKVVES